MKREKSGDPGKSCFVLVQLGICGLTTGPSAIRPPLLSLLTLPTITVPRKAQPIPARRPQRNASTRSAIVRNQLRRSTAPPPSASMTKPGVSAVQSRGLRGAAISASHNRSSIRSASAIRTACPRPIRHRAIKPCSSRRHEAQGSSAKPELAIVVSKPPRSKMRRSSPSAAGASRRMPQ